MNNPLNMVKSFISQSGSPRDLLINFMNQNPNNAMFNNLIQKAKDGNTEEVEQFARNMFKERGRDFDKEFSQFKQFFRS